MSRNPRRAYDAEGREIAPMMLANMREHGVLSVDAECQACKRQVLVNVERWGDEAGLGPVTADERLNRAAEHQARAVAATGILDHGEFTSRMAAYGIRGYRAENLAAGSEKVEEVIARWKASPGHNQNMLLPQVSRVGLARVDTPGSGWGLDWALVLSSEQR